MFGRTKRGSTVSTVVVALALVLTAFLPDIVAGKPGPAAPAHQTAKGVAPRPEITPATFTDTTVADFGAGTPDAGTYISETTDGEVILAPAFGTEFSGDAVPDSMSVAQWFPPNGSATVAGGKLTVDAVRVGTNALYGPGRSLEFSAHFTGAALNSSGFGQTFAAAPWTVFRTGLFPFSLMVNTNNGTSQSGNVPGSMFGSFHRYRIDWKADSVAYYVDGALVTTHTNAPTADMRPLFSDLFTGGLNQVVDWVRMTPYADTGVFTSRVFDAGSNARWVDLQSTSEMPAGTNIVFATRSGDTATPDETWSPWADLSGNLITSPNGRYLQYRATLATSDVSLTPALQSATVSYFAPCGPEICNGIDDDCDGVIDNGTSLCDDGNACTKDACVDGQCVFTPTPNISCDDRNACTDHDTCNNDGACAGSPIICNDDNPCTADACENGLCVFVPTPRIDCSDGDACTTGDVCNTDGKCMGTAITCNDENPCTADTCENGQCVFRKTPNATCDDGDGCTEGDRCVEDSSGGITCQGTPFNCDDNNPCTSDRCEPQGCVVPDNGEGTADLPPQGCGYVGQSDLMIIDGLPAGTTIELAATHKNFSCPTVAPFCSFAPPIPGVDCDQPGGTLGGEEACADSTLALNLTGTGSLAGYSRTIDLAVGIQMSAATRTLGDPVQSFTTDMSSLTGQITGDPDFDLLRLTAGTDFGLPSPGHTTLTQVSGGNWAVDSFFDITYRIDFVGAPGGTLAGMSGSTTGTVRFNTGGRQCVHTPVNCDDGDPCTTDRCNPDSGKCEHLPLVCDDGNACTKDACVDGQCVFTPTPNISCDDRNACTDHDTCNNDGVCVGRDIVCDDGNVCTIDSCNPSTGCVNTPGNAGTVCRPSAGACDLAETCTGTGADCPPDAKSTALCRASAGPCDAAESCDGASNDCPADAFVPATTVCRASAGACDLAETCTGTGADCPADAKSTALCRASAGPCDAAESCDGASNDGDACTQSDSCQAGICVGSNPVVCAALGQCHMSGTCDPATGTCSNPSKPDGSTCNDGNACTTGDVCRNGQCAGGPPLSCDDGNSCTADACDPKAGCLHAPVVILQPVCTINPGTLNLNAQGSSFTINMSVVDACNPANPSPIPPDSLGIAHVSRAGNSTLPDPASLPCPGPGGDTRFETGLFEDLAARAISGNTASLKFDRPSDGNCSTLDGNRQDLAAAMSDVTDGSTANVCVSSAVGGQSFQCCASVRVLNRGNRH